MSPTSRGRKRPKRHRPHDQRRAAVRAVQQTLPPELRSAMLATGQEIMRGEGRLHAEVMASRLVGIWWGLELVDAVDVEEALGGALVADAARRRTSENLALLTSLAAVTEGRLGIEAATAALGLAGVGVSGPSWLDDLGRPEPVSFHLARDATGDGASVLSLFAYPGEAPHVVSVMIDRNLGGLAKDAWATPAGTEILERYREACTKDVGMTIEEIAPGRARVLVERAWSVSDRAIRHDAPVTDEARDHRALSLARMRALPGDAGDGGLAAHDAVFRGDSDEVERFLQRPDVLSLKPKRAVKYLAHQIPAASLAFDDGRDLRVSAVKTELMLTTWLPQLGTVNDMSETLMVEILAAWCRYAVERTGLPPSVLEECEASLARFGPSLGNAMRAAADDPLAYLREEAMIGLDVWERAENLQRLAFTLPSEPDLWMLENPDLREDAFHELFARAHPEYDGAAASLADPPEGEVNWRLHVTLHTVIANQLWLDDPPEVWQTARRLSLGPYDSHEIHHMLMNALSEPLRLSLVERQEAFDTALYLDLLAALPGSWEEQRPG